MKLIILTIILLFKFSSCMKSQNTTIPIGIKENSSSNEAVAAFAEGCFWHSEIIFQSLAGVRDAVSGYAVLSQYSLLYGLYFVKIISQSKHQIIKLVKQE